MHSSQKGTVFKYSYIHQWNTSIPDPLQNFWFHCISLEFMRSEATDNFAHVLKHGSLDYNLY